MLKTVEKNYVSEIIIKKSRFIASLFYVETEEEANKKIKEVSKKYFDAKHNCFAYRIRQENEIKQKYSDDGEPSGTAGQPILNILNKMNLENVLIVVTRYFGGILLGTGGLVRAYTDGAKNVVQNAKIINKEIGQKIKIEISYQNLEKLTYYMRQKKINICKIDYQENAKIYIEISNEKVQELKYDAENLKILSMEVIEPKCYFSVEIS